MEKRIKRHGAEISFSSINPLELWDRLGLAQPSVQKRPDDVDLFPIQFLDEEENNAYAAFKEDCCHSDEDMDVENMEVNPTIPADKGSLFLWALLQENGKRSNKRLSSVNHIFKDRMVRTILRKGKVFSVSFDEADFDTIVSFLQKKDLIRTSKAAIRITRVFTELFHKKYDAWLVF